MATAYEVVARYESASSPGTFYEVKQNQDGAFSCNCRGWIFSGKKPGGRTCAHVRKYEAQGMLPMAPTPKPTPAPMAAAADSLTRTPPSRCTGRFREEILTDNEWVAEPKYDGGRYMLHLETDGQVHLFSRRDFPRIDKAEQVPHFAKRYPGLEGTILDGEVIIERAVKPTLQWVPLAETTAIMNSLPKTAIMRQREPGCRLHYCVFDVLAVNGKDTRHLPLRERRALLEVIIARMQETTDAVILVPQHQDKDGLFRSMLAAGLEGTVLKSLNQGYGKDWVKCKRVADFSVIISGFKAGKGKYEGSLGAVAVSVYHEGKLVEVGFASGMTDAERDHIWQHQSQYLGKVVDVAAQEITPDGRLRHPRWLRLRDDVAPETCTLTKLVEDAKNARRAASNG